MDGFQLHSDPFYFKRSTQTSFFRGIYLERDRMPVVVKCYKIDLHDDRRKFDQALNVGMAQTRVNHPNCCKILKAGVNFDDYPHISVFHVLEALDTNLQWEIEERMSDARPFSEAELRTLLAQISSALAFAHSKEQLIAHCNVKPTKILKDSQGNYKLNDFDYFFEGRSLDDKGEDISGTISYMSPQQREFIAGSSNSYNAFKTDVYSLGLTAVAAASLELRKNLWPLDGLEEKARSVVQALGYSQELKQLLISMVSYKEAQRPSMHQVHDALTQPSPRAV